MSKISKTSVMLNDMFRVLLGAEKVLASMPAAARSHALPCLSSGFQVPDPNFEPRQAQPSEDVPTDSSPIITPPPSSSSTSSPSSSVAASNLPSNVSAGAPAYVVDVQDLAAVSATENIASIFDNDFPPHQRTALDPPMDLPIPTPANNIAATSQAKPSSSSSSSSSSSASSASSVIYTPKPRNFVPREKAVPASALSRFFNFGGLAVGLVAGTAAEAVRRTTGITDPAETARSYVLTDSNVDRLTMTLCKMRGAALKLGQMLSMQDDKFIPPLLRTALEQARQNANVMPRKQLDKVMNAELGENWRARLQHFEDTPIAAASIGQVHKAVLLGGTEVAMKIQYPGVAESIDSDLHNLKLIVKTTNLFPRGMYIDALVREVRDELLYECDYVKEAANQRTMKNLLVDDPRYLVPAVFDEFTTKRIFTSEYINAFTLDEVAEMDQATRNRVGESLLHLCLRELFEFRFMQTDPNPANFFYDRNRDKVVLIDFGAGRSYPKSFVDDYMRVVHGAAHNDHQTIIDSSIKMGFLTGEESKMMFDAHVQAVLAVGTPFAANGLYDFGKQTLTDKVYDLAPTMLHHRLTPPPPESYSLHRKLSGCFLLCARLKSVVPARELFMNIYNKYKFGPEPTVASEVTEPTAQ